jgi:tetratricopeptide (TPR) repeat protein
LESAARCDFNSAARVQKNPITAPINSPDPSAWRTTIFAATALIVATIAAYHGVLSAPFIFDDYPAIARNDSLRSLGTALQPPVTAAGAAGRPLTNLTLALNHAAGGLAPRGYHATNLALHVATALALWALLRRTLARVTALRADRHAIAAVAALGWAVHPLGSEAVVCIVQRNELLVALALLLMLHYLALAADSATPSRERAWLAGSVVFCALGMASKESMVGAPLLALLYDRAFLAGGFARAVRGRAAYYAALAATWGLLAVLVAGHAQRAGTAGFGLGTGVWEYLLTQCRALVIYLELVIWPHPLVLDYGFALDRTLAAVWPQAALVVTLLAGTAVALWRRPAWGFLGATFFVWLAPSSSFVPLTTQTIAEHRMYLPLAIPIVAATIALRGAARWPVVVGLALAWSTVTIARVEAYRTEAAIWADTLAKRPDNPRAHASLARVMAADGRTAEALARYEAALRLAPDFADAQNDYANTLAHAGRIDEALAHYAIAQQLKPDDDAIRRNHALALARTDRLDTAIGLLRAVAGRHPRSAETQTQLGDALLKAGRPVEALAAFEAALAIEPDAPAAHNNAGIALVALGRFTEAVGHYERAVRRLPNSAQVRHNFALALDGARRLEEAIAQEEAALRLAPDFAAAREHLAELRAVARQR